MAPQPLPPLCSPPCETPLPFNPVNLVNPVKNSVPRRSYNSVIFHPLFASGKTRSIIDRMSTSQDLTTPVDDLKNQATQVVRKVSDQLNDQANSLRDATTEARYATQEFIENNPWQSVAMAAGIGLLLGIIIARR